MQLPESLRQLASRIKGIGKHNDPINVSRILLVGDEASIEVQSNGLRVDRDLDEQPQRSFEILPTLAVSTEALGDFLALLRVARGMRQEDLAKTLGIEQAHVARYERHDYTGYSLDNLDRLLGALGVRLTLGKGQLERAA